MPFPEPVLLVQVGAVDVFQSTDDERVFFFASGMRIDADGASRAYHPEGSPGLDHLGNAGKPGNWWGIVTDDGTPGGAPVVQGAEDPAPGYYVSPTALADPAVKDRKNPRRYVDSEAINFIVLPSQPKTPARLGDCAAIVRPETGQVAFGIYADVGPRNKIGEGSIALAQALDVPSSPRTGGVDAGMVYVVFSGSGDGKPKTPSEIDAVAGAAFASWGGLERVREHFPDLSWP